MFVKKPIVLSLLVLAVIGLAGCSNPFEGAPEPTPLPLNLTGAAADVAPPSSYTVTRGPVSQVMLIPGSVNTALQQELMFEKTGRIAKLYVTSGSRVEAGQPIAGLQDIDEQFELTEAQLGVQLAEEQVARAQVEQRFEELDRQLSLQTEQLLLDGIKFSSNFYTPTQVAVQEIAVRQAQLALDRLASEANPQNQYDLYLAQLELQRAQTAISRTQLLAPIAGEVRFADVLQLGKVVQPFAIVGSVVDPESLVVEATLASSDLERLSEGMPVTLKLGSGETQRELPGKVMRLPQPYGSGTRTVAEFAPVNPVDTNLLRPGIPVEIIAELARVEETLWLPPDAVLGFKDNYFVRLPDGNQLPVKVGIFGQDRVELLEGVEEGTTVMGR